MTDSGISRALAAEERLLEEDEISLPGGGTLACLGAADPGSEEPGLPLYWRDPSDQVWAVALTVTARTVDPASLPAAVRQQVTSTDMA